MTDRTGIKSWRETWGGIDWTYDSDEEILKKIDLLVGENPNMKGDGGYTPLILAAINNRTPIVRKLLEIGAEVDMTDRNFSWNAIVWASAKGHDDVVKELISWGADVNSKDLWSYSALMAACADGHPSVVEILAKNGADVDAADYNGKTALMWAAMNDHVMAIDMLINYDANLNIRNREDKTALMLAAERGKLNAVRRLIVDVAIDLEVPKDWYTATKYNYPEAIGLIDNFEKVRAEYKEEFLNANKAAEEETPVDERAAMRAELQKLHEREKELKAALQTATPERKEMAEKLRKITNHELRRKIAKDIKDGRIRME